MSLRVIQRWNNVDTATRDVFAGQALLHPFMHLSKFLDPRIRHSTSIRSIRSLYDTFFSERMNFEQIVTYSYPGLIFWNGANSYRSLKFTLEINCLSVGINVEISIQLMGSCTNHISTLHKCHNFDPKYLRRHGWASTIYQHCINVTLRRLQQKHKINVETMSSVCCVVWLRFSCKIGI